MLAIATAVALALVLPATGRAQGEEMPTELWSEYPLLRDAERNRGAPSIGPFLPPFDTGAEPAAGGEPTPWAIWIVATALGLLAITAVTRVALPAVSPRSERAPRGVLPRPRSRRTWGASESRPLGQYAPSSSVVLYDVDERESRRSVVRRTGILRARFVVLADAMAGDYEAVSRSRSFWNVGPVASRELSAEDAWDELMNDLRVAGWEPDPTRRSDYYALLRRIEPSESSTDPIVTAYDRVAPYLDDDR